MLLEELTQIILEGQKEKQEKVKNLLTLVGISEKDAEDLISRDRTSKGSVSKTHFEAGLNKNEYNKIKKILTKSVGEPNEYSEEGSKYVEWKIKGKTVYLETYKSHSMFLCVDGKLN